MIANGHPLSTEGTLQFNQPTAEAVCTILGYDKAVSFDDNCPAYDNRTGYSSPHDNLLYSWNGNSFTENNAAAAGNKWLGQLSCIKE